MGQSQELAMLRADPPDFPQTSAYLRPLIENALDDFELSDDLRLDLLKEIVGDVPIAATRYLQYRQSVSDYNFSTYFTWYIAERLNVRKDMKKKRPR